MFDHFKVPEDKLAKLNLSLQDQIKSLPMFGPKEAPNTHNRFIEKPFSHVNLMFYIDNCGSSFMIVQKHPHQKIAKLMFDCMESKKKLDILSYIEWTEEEE